MNDDLQSFIEPELEARLVALILGEASAFEVEELDRILKERPEVALAKQRLEEAHELVGQAMAEPADDDEWKLSPERRDKVLAVMSEASSEVEEADVIKERRISIAQWRSIYATAACLMVAVVVLALVAPVAEKFGSERDPMVLKAAREESLGEEILDQRDIVESNRRSLAVLEEQYGLSYFDAPASSPVGQNEERLYRNAQSHLDGLEKKRSSLQTKLNGRVIASNGDIDFNASEPDKLADELKLVEKQVARLNKFVSEKKDGSVDLSMQQHQFSVAKEEYEESKLMLREMEVKQEEFRSANGLPPVDRAGSDHRTTRAKDYLAAIDAGLGTPAPDKPQSGESSNKPVGYESLVSLDESIESTRGSGRSRFGRPESLVESEKGRDLSVVDEGIILDLAESDESKKKSLRWGAESKEPQALAKKEEFAKSDGESSSEHWGFAGVATNGRTAGGQESNKRLGGIEKDLTGDLPEIGRMFDSRREAEPQESAEASKWYTKRSNAESDDLFDVELAPATQPVLPKPKSPKKPSSSMARAATATPAEPKSASKPEVLAANIAPVAELPVVPSPDADFGDGDGFGNGWGVGGGGGGKKAAEKPGDSAFPVTPATPGGEEDRLAQADPFALGDGAQGLSYSTRGKVVAGGLVVTEGELAESTFSEQPQRRKSLQRKSKAVDGAVRTVNVNGVASLEERSPEVEERFEREGQRTTRGFALEVDSKGEKKNRRLSELSLADNDFDGVELQEKQSKDSNGDALGLQSLDDLNEAVPGQNFTGTATGGMRDEYAYLKLDGGVSSGKMLDGKKLLKGQGKTTIVTDGDDTLWARDDQPVVKGPNVIDEEETEASITAELRSGRAAVNRNSVDAILNNPEGVKNRDALSLGSDQIRRNLYKGEGFSDLGLYGKAEEEFKEVLRADPYNKAARRSLEKLSAIKSDYYRAAYDETRARMLMEVEQAWELAIPPVEGEDKAVADAEHGISDTTKGMLPPVGAESDEIVTRRFSVPSTFENFLSSGGGDGPASDDDPFATDDQGGGSGIKARKPIAELLKEQGIVFPEGAAAAYDPASGQLIVRNTRENLELVDAITATAGKPDGREEEFARSYSYRNEDLNEKSESELAAIPLYAEESSVDRGTSNTASKMQSIILPEVNLENATVGEAMAILEQGALTHDPDGEGLQLDVRKPRVNQPEFDDNLDAEGGLLGEVVDPNSITIDKLYLTNVPLQVAAQYVADKAKLRYKIDDGKVTFLPLTSGETDDVVTRRWDVPESFESFLTENGVEGGDDDPFASKGNEKESADSLLEILRNQGVSFVDGSSATYLSGSRSIVVRNTPTQLELIDAIVGASYANDKGLKAKEEAKKAAKEKRLNFETLTSEKTDSTFSLNVSDVSFKLAKSALAEGKWPEATKVRPEEFVNALGYEDRKPSQSEKVACAIEQGAHPFMQQRNLMRVSMSTAALGRNASTPLRLTVLLDQSGSMERADRAESVKRAFDLLTDQLNAGDEISLVGFARTPRLLAERVKGNESKKLLEIVSRTLTEGGTNLEEALDSGIQLAKQQFVEGAQNRIILLTDGAANLGDALPANLAKQVEEMRQADIAFDACGVGADGLNDEVLSSLAKQGDGRYYFLDRPEDADEGFARQIAGALRPAAKNVKVQVIFNPERVSKFKLYGFEKHLLKKEDFRNDTVDAAEMAAEESGVALYHFEALPDGEGDVGYVSVRFLDTASDRMVERTWPIPYEENTSGFSDADPALRLAGTAALFAEKLKGSAVGERVQLKQLRKEVDSLQSVYQNQIRYQEFRTMLQQAGE